MRQLILILSLLLVGCQVQQPLKAPVAEYPTVNLPETLRQSNWLSRGSGSCVHATLISLFRWQGKFEFADWWKQTHGGGEFAWTTEQQLNAAGVRYASTDDRNNVAFLEAACRTRRGCGVTVMGGAHMVALVHLDDKWAAILDNNRVDQFNWVPRETFLSEWRNSGSWAITPVYTPAPPLP